MVHLPIDRDVVAEVIGVHQAPANVHPDLLQVSRTDDAVPFTSPVRKVMVAEASTEPEAPFTPGTVTVISEPSQVTCPSSTVTVEPLIVVLLTRPQVVVVVPEILVTGSEKVNTMACRNVPPFPTRHSTPGLPVSGKSISKVPALPCFLRDAALTSVSSGEPA